MTRISITSSSSFYEEMRQLFEGRIKCACGNDDWKQFVYVKGGRAVDNIVAACKDCGRRVPDAESTETIVL